tara:strand:+ start:468 stop:647 length:180 start_codon:yes stop_codon:yes gene_type:complete
MNEFDVAQLKEDINNCKKNIEICKDVLKNINNNLYQEVQCLIIYNNKLKNYESTLPNKN